MKKIICVVLVLCMLFSLTACNVRETENTTGAVKSDLIDDASPIYGQDPLAVIPGDYAAVGIKATALVKLLEAGKVNITINTTDDALNYTEWSMTGEMDDNLTIVFKDDVMKMVKLDDNNVVVSEDTVYTDGSGTVVFDKNALKFTWEDKKSDQGALTFGKE